MPDAWAKPELPKSYDVKTSRFGTSAEAAPAATKGAGCAAVPIRNGVSRRITNEEERHRLKELMRRIRKPEYGYIVRTVCEGVSEEDLLSDTKFLTALWEDISKAYDSKPAPSLLHTDLSLPLRVVRDLFTKKVDRLLIDSKAEFDEVKDFVRRYLPEQTSQVHFYDKIFYAP